MTATRSVKFAIVTCLLLLPNAARAQVVSGGIAGEVRDTTGAVLPGVTVEAASPALIEKVRVAITDGQGRYNIIDLRPGTYTVTFSLPGFATFRREALQLTTGFTATVNAEMRLGSLEETVTVTGASPVVDIRNVLQQRQLPRATLDALPVTNTSAVSFAPLIVGATLTTPTAQNVGGNQGQAGPNFRVHGGGIVKRYFDGMPLNNTAGAGTSGPVVGNHATTEEVVFQSVNMADTETGGVVFNIVPREGGNSFTGYFFATDVTDALQSDNRTDALRARGLTADASIKRVYDYAGALGGPIKRDRLWFYTGHRQWGTSRWVPGNYYNATQGTPFYTPDLSRPAHEDAYFREHSVRFTWQASEKQRLSITYNDQPSCNCFFGISGTVAPEATHLRKYRTKMPQVRWTYPATNRFLFEAGFQGMWYRAGGRDSFVEGVTENDIHVLELSTNYRYGSLADGLTLTGAYGAKLGNKYTQRFSMSYVTGSHNVKVGGMVEGIKTDEDNIINQAISFRFRNQRPEGVTVWAQPHNNSEVMWPKLGFYAQDQWVMRRRLTFNYGVRFDSIDAHVSAQELPAGPFVDARRFPETRHVPSWRDIAPRLGGAYDLFGNGRTAVKAYLGRFVGETQTNFARSANPTNTTVNSATRSWNDVNGNFVPDCDLRNPAANRECGPTDFTTFGQARIVTRFDDNLLKGWGKRDYNWQGSVSIQHELAQNIGLNVAYFRVSYANFQATDNLAVTPADYDRYCITAPVDARLPGGGGSQICGLYDITPAKFGVSDVLVTNASNFGKQIEVYNGMEFSINARFAEGAHLAGGVAAGRTVTDNCDVVVDSPQKRFCRQTIPFAGGTQVKLNGAYPLPWWGVRASATYQNLPWIPITASYVATNADIAPSLGRNLAAGVRATALLELIEPNTLREGRISQLDVRLSRIFRLGGKVRMTGNFDIANALNASPILAMNTRYGPQWLQPQAILAGRLFKFGIQLDF